jgi:surface protein
MYINERLKITSKSKSLSVRPTSYSELKVIIDKELKRQGLDADLNFIDTSEITDMSKLFDLLHIENIKIDEWDVSNVTDMSFMFMNQDKFSCDLSKWDVSNVTKHEYAFLGCYKMQPKFRPNFK